jgi:predicted unusual protein kinase regulating ubiquinone biosynthesis (AarF/ABC1/UbiB family)
MSERTYKDGGSFGGRMRRHAHVGGSVGVLAARFATGRLLSMALDRGEHAEDLKVALGGLKGPLMKVAQILSTIPDALPSEYTEQLAELQNNAPSMGWAFVRRRMATELGADWQKLYKAFEHEASAAASLGQVHRAVSPDGRQLACKLQYPDMRSAVEADLSQLKLVFSLYRRYDKSIDFSDIHTELADRLDEELDYRREAQNMALYRHVLAKEPGVRVPDVEPDLSTDRLLTMSWLDGVPLLTLKDADQEVRNTIAINMFRAWYVPFYQYGVIHGDPHLGNYSVRSDSSINLLDFGSIRVFTPSFVTSVINLYKAVRDDDEALAVHAYETWGFKGLDRAMIAILNQWAEFIYAPLLEDRVRAIQDGGSTIYGAQVAAKVHRELREAGGIKPPREFVLMDRAAIGLGSVFLHLKAEINWYQLFQGLIADYDEGTLGRCQKTAFKKAGVPLAY